MNIPGEASSVVTCIDGYQMARQGRAGPALGISAFGSFIGGTVSVVAVMLISPILAETALKFGPPEMFALLFFAFTCIGGLTGKSKTQGLLMASVGLLLGTVGTDEIHGVVFKFIAFLICRRIYFYLHLLIGFRASYYKL